MTNELEQQVADHERHGARRVDKSLGFHKMPDGFALMLDADEMYFYWLQADGRYSEKHWDKWAVRRGAMLRRQANDARGGKVRDGSG
jgi:hypothetical protein